MSTYPVLQLLFYTNILFFCLSYGLMQLIVEQNVSPESLDLLSKLDAFYSSSFSTLVTATLGIVAIIGVLLPIGITWYQNRTFRKIVDGLKQEFSDEADAKLKETEKKLKKKFKRDIRRQSHLTKGVASLARVMYLIQRDKDNSHVIPTYLHMCVAVEHFIKADSHEEVKLALEFLNGLNKNDLVDKKHESVIEADQRLDTKLKVYKKIVAKKYAKKIKKEIKESEV